MKILDRLVAVLLALALTAGGVLLAVEIALAAAGRDPWLVPYDDWYDVGRRNSWDSTGPRLVFAGLIAAGVLLVLVALVKGSPRSLPLPDGRSRAGVHRRSVEQSLARFAGRVDGVGNARARVHRKRTDLVVGTSRQTGDLRPAVEQAAAEHLDRLGLDGAAPPVRVEVERSKKR